MKKTIATIIFLLCLGALFSFFCPLSPVQAQFVEEPPAGQTRSHDTFGQFIDIINFVFALAFVFSIIGLIMSAIKYVIAGGSEKVIGSANATLIASLTGLGISLVGYVIIQIIRYYIR